MKKVYLIGSLRNPAIIDLGNELRELLPDWEVFNDWMAAGPLADDCWKEYEIARGRSYAEGLKGYAARHVFEFDKHHLDSSDAAILCLPAGRSGHLELGYMAGKGKYTAILLDQSYLDDERWDCMYQFADLVADNLESIANELRNL